MSAAYETDEIYVCNIYELWNKELENPFLANQQSLVLQNVKCTYVKLDSINS